MKPRTDAGLRIETSLRQAIDWVRGEEKAARVVYPRSPEVDVRAVRRRMGLTQPEFAARFGFSAWSVRNWEQGRRRPEGPARILLAVIARNPDVVEAVLR